MTLNNIEEFHNDEAKTQKSAEQLHFSAVCKPDGYPEDGHDEDNTYARFSPSADVRIYVANPSLFGKLAVGTKYYVDFTAESVAGSIDFTKESFYAAAKEVSVGLPGYEVGKRLPQSARLPSDQWGGWDEEMSAFNSKNYCSMGMIREYCSRETKGAFDKLMSEAPSGFIPSSFSCRFLPEDKDTNPGGWLFFFRLVGFNSQAALDRASKL